MVRKKRRYGIKTKSRMALISLCFVVVIGTLGYTLFMNFRQIVIIENSIVELEEEKLDIQEDKERIEADIKRLSDKEYIARYAREKYFYSREGEIILRFKE